MAPPQTLPIPKFPPFSRQKRRERSRHGVLFPLCSPVCVSPCFLGLGLACHPNNSTRCLQQIGTAVSFRHFEKSAAGKSKLGSTQFFVQNHIDLDAPRGVVWWGFFLGLPGGNNFTRVWKQMTETFCWQHLNGYISLLFINLSNLEQ
jgi:hypothetical protein